MIDITHVNEAYSSFEINDINLMKKLTKLLSPYADNYKFQPKYRAGLWDGTIPFYKMKGNRIFIPKGLLFYIEKLLQKENIEYKIEFTQYENITKEYLDGFINTLKIPFPLYKYQIQCVYDSLISGRLTNISATGSGKSLIIYTLMRYMLETQRTIMIIVPNIMLINQLYSDFKDYGFCDIDDFIQRIGGDFKDKEIHKPAIITTWQSQYRLELETYDFDAIIVDECHGVNVESQLKEVILPKAKKAKFRWGFTGTLPKSEISKLSIFSALGRPNRVINAQGLIEYGLATPVEVKVVFFNYPQDESQVVLRQKNFNFEEKFITEHIQRNSILMSLANKVSKNGNTLILYSKLSHGDLLLNLLIKKKTQIKEPFEVLKEVTTKNINTLKNIKYFLKIPLNEKIKNTLKKYNFNLENFIQLDELDIFCISGSISAEERERIRNILEYKNNAIILATQKTMSTGVNVKKLHNLIFSSSTKSEITIGQSIGRIMRLHNTKEKVLVYDIVDSMRVKNKENYFLKHFKERMNEYMEYGYPLSEIEINL